MKIRRLTAVKNDVHYLIVKIEKILLKGTNLNKFQKYSDSLDILENIKRELKQIQNL